MLKRIFSTITAVVACMAAGAQGVCVINGTIADNRLSNGEPLEAVSLVGTNDFGQPAEVATAAVENGKYTFRCELAKDEPVLLYVITGFGEGQGIEVFVEQGEVVVNTASAARPCESTVTGTPANDTYSGFKAILANRCGEMQKQLAALPEGSSEASRIESKEDINMLSQAIRYLIDNNASPMTPLVIERRLLNLFTPAYAEQMLKSIAYPLHNHPYTISLRNKVLAGSLKVGNEVPDVVLPLSNGETKHLADYRGKYVVLNFWASGCPKSEDMFVELQALYDVLQGSNGQFVIISFALESDTVAWKEAINSYGINLDGWVNACDGMGASSPAAKLLGVEKAPRIILVEPEGRAVSLNMDIDEVVMRAEQILAGDLYYLDQQEEF